MVNRVWYKVVILCCLCSLLGTGCFWRRKGPGVGDDPFDDTELLEFGEPGGGAMGGARFEDGMRVEGVEFQTVQFDYDSFRISESEIGKIEAVSEYMRANPDVRLVAEGHCDERGSREYNLSLGEHRALAVRAYLVGLGIDGSRIQTRSYGEEQPLDPGHGEGAWSVNRRGEFALYR